MNARCGVMRGCLALNLRATKGGGTHVPPYGFFDITVFASGIKF